MDVSLRLLYAIGDFKDSGPEVLKGDLHLSTAADAIALHFADVGIHAWRWPSH